MKTESLSKKTIMITSLAVIAIMAISVSLNGQLNQKTTEIIEADGTINVFTVDELAKKSKYIVIGKVVSITPTEPMRYDDIGITTIYSDIVIDVENDLKNQLPEKQISVRTIGGQSENIEMIAHNEAKFSVGERVLLFVADKDPKTIFGDHYTVYGLFQGKYKLSDGNAFGNEHKDGIKESDFISKIQKARDLN